ncbi:MAG: sulfatase-like hydrolase/transferase [Cyclobacteriaceae bacterium]
MKQFIGLLLFTLLNFSSAGQPADRPNILWIVSEDNSPFIGAYGDTFATTPNIDLFAAQAVRYTHAFATAPVCAPSRSTLITGLYPSSLGTLHMRSTYPLPAFVKFFPRYLREAGYYTSNNAKKDYNTIDQLEAWDESSQKATYKNRKPGQPFFSVFNIGVSHESQVHNSIPLADLKHDPEQVPIPPYHPRTPEMKHDWAQYYDRIQEMDEQVGAILKELEESGLSDNTIVFYYSDHGGVLGRSKRFMYESGLHIPLIIRFPEKYLHLASGKPGSTTGRIVSFVDFAPTILNLANIDPPAYMQGKAFLGKTQSPQQYAFAFRGRMDERFDMVRSVRDKKFRYIRNYMPHKIYGQYIDYLWKAPSMASWEKAWREGELNDTQSAFWKPKPPEELFDAEADPHNINNLAGNDQYKNVLVRMREENRKWLKETKDAGFIPEPMMIEISKNQSLYDYAHSGQYPLDRILETAELASSKDPADFAELKKRLRDKNPIIRYWAATGCTILSKDAVSAKADLEKLLQDTEISVRIAAAEALYHLSEKEKALATLKDALKSSNLMARVQALNVLETTGKDARSALDEIQKLLKDNIQDGDYDVRAAKRILEKMD